MKPSTIRRATISSRPSEATTAGSRRSARDARRVVSIGPSLARVPREDTRCPRPGTLATCTGVVSTTSFRPCTRITRWRGGACVAAVARADLCCSPRTVRVYIDVCADAGVPHSGHARAPGRTECDTPRRRSMPSSRHYSRRIAFALALVSAGGLAACASVTHTRSDGIIRLDDRARLRDVIDSLQLREVERQLAADG